jgi:tellurite resistance protein TerC
MSSSDTSIWFWIIFNAVVVVLLVLDLAVFHRKVRASSGREALAWAGFWIFLSLCFNVVVWQWKGAEKGLEFLTGYLIEYSLSVDNIFVFVLVFSYFRVPPEHQRRVLFWGILGALVMRGAMIALGVQLVTRFHWVLYIFGAFLLFTGVRMLFEKESGVDVEHNPLVRFCRWLAPISRDYDGAHFTTRVDGRRMLTPLAVVLVTVESTDLLFAVDSIPAIFGITKDPFIVYTSNVCAILGLRSLYFVVGHLVSKFIYLKVGLALVLSFIGIKMLAADFVHIPIAMSLGLVVGILAMSIAVSLVVTRWQDARCATREPEPPQSKDDSSGSPL